jgi:hypothetical protein
VQVIVQEIIVSCAFEAVLIARNVDHTALFLVVVMMSDVMAANFLFLVRDEGSWLEIGTSIRSVGSVLVPPPPPRPWLAGVPYDQLFGRQCQI